MDLIQVAVIVQALFIIGGYDRRTDMRTLSYTTEHILAVLVAGALSALLIYSAATYDQTMKPSRGVLLLSFAFFLAISLGYRRLISKFVSASTATRKFVVIGSGREAAEFYRAYKKSPSLQHLHFVDCRDERVGMPIDGEGSPMIEGNCAKVLDELDHQCSGVILADKAERLSRELLDRLARTQFQQTRVYTVESFSEAHWRRVPVSAVDPFWPLQMGFQLARMSPYHYVKRLFDVLITLLTAAVWIPLSGLVTLLVWIECGRPVIFRQERVGRENQIFTLLKFRTMRQQSPEDEEENMYALKDDPRITRVGRWLHKLRLDELPQLWNVLRGDMSLIGPRAEWVKCADRYEKKIPFYHFRHLVKPGVTGWAQVNYPYGESEEDAIEKLKYDLYYIRHYSLKLDAMIMLKTVHTMLFGKGR